MIYLDNAATTPVHPDVLAAMQPYFSEVFGNPSSVHAFGREARAGLDTARTQLAQLIGCRPDEVVFTSGGTESIHSALLGAFLAAGERKHLVTTAIEHHAVLHTCDFLQALGAQVSVVEPASDGRVNAEDILAAMREDTFLVSVMGVNNELGTVLPVRDIAAAVKQRNSDTLVHSDTVQALGTQVLELGQTEIDLASFSAHKIHGPKGTGALYVKHGKPWQSVLRGGTQERDRRGGTENVAGIVGFGAAAARLRTEWSAHLEQLTRAREEFWSVISQLPGVFKNSPDDAAPSILNVAFSGVRSETLLMRLDLEGVAASAGSACTAGSLEPSHVLLACGMAPERVHQSIRFSFSELLSTDDVRSAANTVVRVVQILRKKAGS